MTILSLVLILVFINIPLQIQQVLVVLIGLITIFSFNLFKLESTIPWIKSLREPEKNISLSKNKLIRDLPRVRNRLISLKNLDKDELIQISLSIVLDTLNAQTASIFLLSKEGNLERAGIQGIDKNGNILENNWLSDESYAIGESLTGRASYPKGDGYGSPQLTNRLSEEKLAEKNRNAYLEKLGELSSAIAIPLNGQNKTYGILRVINKIDKETKEIIPNSQFSSEEVDWLSVIGAFVANVISNYRRDRQSKLYSDLSRFLAESDHEGFNPKLVYNEVVNRLVSEETAFKACILRIRTESNTLKVEARGGISSIDWSKRRDEEIKLGEGLPGSAAQRSEPIILKEINEGNVEQFFKNKDWILENHFKSFACFRIVYKEKVLGTLSLYTGYKYDFHSSCRSFLERVTSLVAAFIHRINRSRKVDKTVDEVYTVLTELTSEPNTKPNVKKIDEVKRHLESTFAIDTATSNKDFNKNLDLTKNLD